jgi:hypothetical protein
VVEPLLCGRGRGVGASNISLLPPSIWMDAVSSGELLRCLRLVRGANLSEIVWRGKTW